MGRPSLSLLVIALALVACETAKPPQESPEAVPIVAQAKPARSPAPAPTFAIDWEHGDDFERDALALDPEEVARLGDAALAGDDDDVHKYLFVLWARGDVAETRALRGSLLARGDDETFGMFAELMLDLAAGEPHLLYQLAEDAHAAGFPMTLRMLGEYAQHDAFAVDAYDRQRIGEMLVSMEPDGSFRSAAVLARLHLEGVPELGIPANPERAAALFEAAAIAGTPNETYEIAGELQDGENAPRDLRRAQQLFALAGDKGHAVGHNDSAWLMTTCSGFTSSEHAQALVQIEQNLAEHGRSAMTVDTLAAVYARLGRYDDAVAAQTSAMRLLEQEDPDNDERRAEFEARLMLYRNGSPYDTPDC